MTHADAHERTASMELVPTRKLHILTGRTHPVLAEEIAANLGLELSDAYPRGLRQR